MRLSTLGATGVTVTELALGAAPLAGLYRPVDPAAARAAVDAAWDAGVRCFDTAPHYGLGLSERRLGAALAGRPRDRYTLSTKVGRLLRPLPPPHRGDDPAGGFAVPATHERVWDFSAAGVRRSLTDSLDRLGLDRIDIAYLHDPDDHAGPAFGEALPELARLRAEGAVSAIGAGMNQTDMLTRFVRHRGITVDVVLCAGRYTLLDQDALRELLPAAARHGTSVVIGGAFNSGLLADPRPGATYDYSAAPRPLLRRALRLKEVCEEHGVPLRAAALQFPLGHPAVSSVLVGARSAEEVRDAAAMMARPVPETLWDRLRAEGLLPPRVPVPPERAAS
ncbi:aldo/keto reductase [Streptomyces aidingensis]|uniref:D-threo-aldose 1-dehydrogenase n=1 Tax=Streptomyces aidingensis TaxID=910347 RepID=A0A1I1JFE0_9ACTN|nr:aldo/keto reductase [Streptomyces aidingensis]SFC47065.1 D-threo-aldose 1-dehydrogenase [Streptomyces aidingensis]